jgi:16S rRNA U1498 N3-methylase RsmE
MSTVETFFAEDLSSNKFSVLPKELKHLLNVKRYQAGDIVEFTNGRGLGKTVRICSVEPFEFEVISERVIMHKELEVTLIQALIKGDRF